MFYTRCVTWFVLYSTQDHQKSSLFSSVRCEMISEMRMERLFISITGSFRSPRGGCFVLKRRGAYVPPTIPQIYHPNHKPDPGFRICIEKKSASGAATENKQPEHPTRTVDHGTFCCGFKMYRSSSYNKPPRTWNEFSSGWSDINL